MAITYEAKTLFNGRVEFVPIKLRREWMGNPKGHKLVIAKRQADILVDRGAAEILEGDKKKPITLKRRKVISSPPIDKMVKEVEKTKS